MRVRGLSITWGMAAVAALTSSAAFASPQSDQILSDLRSAIQISPGLSLVEVKFGNFDMGTIYNPLLPGGNTNVADAPPIVANPNVAAGITSLDGLISAAATGAFGSEDSWGIAKVTSAHDTALNTLYTDGKYGTEVTIMFHSERDYWVTHTPNGDQLVNGVGLQIDVYVDTTPDFTPVAGSGGRTGVASYNTVTDGELVLSLLSIPGHLNDPAENGGNMAEFESRFNATSSTGQGEAWLKVIGGNWATAFDNNFFPVPAVNSALGFENADAHAKFETFPVTVPNWLVRSNDPLRLVVNSAVPEPMTAGLGMIALGALAAAGTRRRA